MTTRPRPDVGAGHVRIAPYSPDHEDAVVELVLVQTPGATHEEIRHELTDVERCRTRLVAVAGDLVVGLGEILHPPWLDERHVTVLVRVDERYRGARIGGTLHRTIAAHVPRRVHALSTVEDDDERSLHIAEHWGFAAYQHAIQSQLTLPAEVAAPTPREGTALRRLVDLHRVEDPELDLLLDDADTSPEAAETGTMGLSEFGRFPDTFAVVACVGAAPAAITIATQSATHAHVLITATRPRFRRTGLAELIKRELHAVAASRGVERITTTNEGGNEGIRHLNAALGYERISGSYRVRRPATVDPTSLPSLRRDRAPSAG